MRAVSRDPQVDAAYRHCAAASRASGSSFLAAFWMFPRSQRLALHAIYAFCRMADDIADDESVRGDRQRLVELWRRELEDAYLGKAVHPVGIALGHATNRFGIEQEWFQALLDGVESDLRGDTIDSFEDLEAYCYCVASTIGLMIVTLRGMQGPAVREYAISLGIAVQLTNILRDVGEDARAGRVYLAREDLQRLGVAEDDLSQRRPTHEVRQLFGLYAERAQLRYERAQQALPAELLREARPAQAMGEIYHQLLTTLRSQDCPGLAHSVRLSKTRRLSIAARVWLGAGASP